MMSRPLKYLYLLLACCTLQQLQAQVLIKALPDKSHILIGEPLQLTIEVRMPLGSNYQFAMPDSLFHWEYLKKDSLAKQETIDAKQLRQVFVITSYDSGYQQIPRISIKVGGKLYYSDTTGVRVDYAPMDPNADYRDIKPIEEAAAGTIDKKVFWLAGVGAIALIGLLIWLLRRKKVLSTPVEQPRVDSWEGYLAELEETRSAYQQGKIPVKSYYSRLETTYRHFLEWKKSWKVMEKTNRELLIQSRVLEMPEPMYQALTAALQTGDFVKFAKYQPAPEECEHYYTVLRDVMQFTQNIPDRAV